MKTSKKFSTDSLSGEWSWLLTTSTEKSKLEDVQHRPDICFKEHQRKMFGMEGTIIHQ